MNLYLITLVNDDHEMFPTVSRAFIDAGIKISRDESDDDGILWAESALDKATFTTTADAIVDTLSIRFRVPLCITVS